MSDWNLSRRTFLKATGTLGTAAAVGVGGSKLLKHGAAAQAVAAQGGEELKRSICDMCCIGYCGIEVFVEDGRATRFQQYTDTAQVRDAMSANV